MKNWFNSKLPLNNSINKENKNISKNVKKNEENKKKMIKM